MPVVIYAITPWLIHKSDDVFSLHTAVSSGCCTSLGRSYILSLTVKVNDMGDGSLVHIPGLILLPNHLLVSSLSLRPCLPTFYFLNSPPPRSLSLPISTPPLSFTQPCSTPTTWICCFLPLVLPLCFSFTVINSLYRSAVAVHCCRVPVHPPAVHRRHPHVPWGVSVWQCHRWPQAQRLRRHIHCALRLVASNGV